MPEPPAPIPVVGAAIVEGGRCLVARRGRAMTNPLQWELPGGKVEPGEEPRQALVREIEEELGIRIEVGRFLGEGLGSGGGRPIRLRVYLARRLHGDPHPHEHDALAWVGREELAGLDWAEADLPILPALAAHLRGRDDS